MSIKIAVGSTNGIGAFEAKDTIEKAFSKLYIYYKRTKQIL